MSGRVGVCVSFLLLIPCLNACGVSHRYGTDDVSTIHTLAGQRMVVPAVMDARNNGRPVSGEAATEDAREELSELRDSVSEHVSRAGVEALTAPAPESPAEVAALLDRAKNAGVREVMFLRYHGTAAGTGCATVGDALMFAGIVPYLIIQSIPLSRRAATAGFEAFVVDPSSGEVLATAARLASGADRVNQWRCHNPESLMHHVMRGAVDDILNDLAAQRSDGYPRRFRPANPVGFVSEAPAVRAVGSRVEGLGWSHPLPGGWTFDASVGDTGGVRSPSGTELTVALGWCIGGTTRCATLQQRVLVREGEELVDRVDVEHDGAPAARFETRRPDGTRVLVGVIGRNGVTMQMTCAAPGGAPESDLGVCTATFDAAAVHVSRVAE